LCRRTTKLTCRRTYGGLALVSKSGTAQNVAGPVQRLVRRHYSNARNASVRSMSFEMVVFLLPFVSLSYHFKTLLETTYFFPSRFTWPAATKRRNPPRSSCVVKTA